MRSIQARNVRVPARGLTLGFGPPFPAAPQVTVRATEAGKRAEVSDITASGAAIRVIGPDGRPCAGAIEYTAKEAS